MVMNLWVPWHTEYFLTSKGSISFPRTNLLHAVTWLVCLLLESNILTHLHPQLCPYNLTLTASVTARIQIWKRGALMQNVKTVVVPAAIYYIFNTVCFSTLCWSQVTPQTYKNSAIHERKYGQRLWSPLSGQVICIKGRCKIQMFYTKLQIQQFHKADSIVKFTVTWFYQQC